MLKKWMKFWGLLSGKSYIRQHCLWVTEINCNYPGTPDLLVPAAELGLLSNTALQYPRPTNAAEQVDTCM